MLEGAEITYRQEISEEESALAFSLLENFAGLDDTPRINIVQDENIPPRLLQYWPIDKSLNQHFQVLRTYADDRLCIDQFYLLAAAWEQVFGLLLESKGENPGSGTLGRKWGKIKTLYQSTCWAKSDSKLDLDLNEFIKRRNLFIHHQGLWVPCEYPLKKMSFASCWALSSQTQPAAPGDPLRVDEEYLLHELDLLGYFGDLCNGT